MKYLCVNRLFRIWEALRIAPKKDTAGQLPSGNRPYQIYAEKRCDRQSPTSTDFLSLLIRASANILNSSAITPHLPQQLIFLPKISLEKTKKLLTFTVLIAIILKLSRTATEYGGIAQLGERLNGIQEVSGSIPLISTKES